MDSDGVFAGYRGKRIALYGLGTETHKAIAEFNDYFKIIGLLDGFREDGEMYGQPIISFDDAVKGGVELVIAVARPGSCKAIAKRIGDACRENGLALFDIRGKDLLEATEAAYDFRNVAGETKAALIKKSTGPILSALTCLTRSSRGRSIRIRTFLNWPTAN